MFTARPIRPALACWLACALLTLAMSSAAAASSSQDLRSPDTRDAASASRLAASTPTPRQDLRTPDARDASRDVEIALAQERYLSSYGEAPALPLSQAPAPSDDTQWLPLAFFLAAALATVAVGAAQLRRLVIRRRRTVRATA